MSTSTTGRAFTLCSTLLLLLIAQSGCHPPVSTTVVPMQEVDQMALFIGEGRLSHPPEFVELTVTVHSKCYPTPMEAVQAADAAVSRVMTLLGAKLDSNNTKDGIFSTGGYTEPYARRVMVNGDSVVVCNGTFQKTATVVMKTSKVETFPQDFAEIQNIVLTTMQNTADPNTPRGITYANLGTPDPQLYYETRERLEQKALADALDNARQKFAATANTACSDTSHRIVKFTEPSPDSGRPIAYGASSSSARGGGAAVEFDAIWINKLLDVYFIIQSECRGS